MSTEDLPPTYWLLVDRGMVLPGAGHGDSRRRVPLSGARDRSGTVPRHFGENASERRAMWRDCRLGELFLLALASGFASIFAFTHGYQIFSVAFATFVGIASVRLVRQEE